jgi:hypothetical protein
MRRVLFILFLPFVAFAQANVMLVDCSGSMKGFFESGSAQELIAMVHEELRGTPCLTLGFTNHKTHPFGGSLQPEAYGSETYISEAFSRELNERKSPRTVWLLTDNIQTNELASGDMAAFFKLLHGGQRVNSVCIYPMLIDFDGFLYGADDKNLGYYAGTSGIMLYQIGLDGLKDNLGETSRSDILNRVKAALGQFKSNGWITNGVQIRPFENEKLDIKLDEAVERVCTFSYGVRDTVKFDKVGIFNVGEPLTLRFPFRPNSALQEYVIRDVHIEPHVMAIAHSDFTLDPTDLSISCTPNWLKNVRGGEYIEVINTQVQIKELAIKSTIPTWISCIRKGTGYLNIPMDIEFSFPKRSIQLDAAFTDVFQSKIPGLDDLAKEIYLDENVVNSKQFFLQIPIQYPLYPVLFLVVFVLVLLGVLYFVGSQYCGRGSWTLCSSAGHRSQLRPLMFCSYSYPEMNLLFVFGSWRVKPRPGFELESELGALSGLDKQYIKLKREDSQRDIDSDLDDEMGTESHELLSTDRVTYTLEPGIQNQQLDASLHEFGQGFEEDNFDTLSDEL